MHRARIVCAFTALCLTAGPGFGQGGDLAAMRDLSADFANAYLRMWSSSDDDALRDVREIYAPQVNFYGRVLDRRGITAEKLRFVRRWPIRRYALRPGTTRVDCDPNRRACIVRTLINWEAAAPRRGRVSRGVSEFELGIGFSGPQPLVLYEGGRVVARRPS